MAECPFSDVQADATVEGVAVEVVAPSRSQRSSWDHEMRARQVRWKREVAGVTEVGQHLGADRDYLFPDDLWFANLLPDYRIAVTRSLARHQIARHQFTHHVMSSQVFALNLAAPFFENPTSLTAVIKSLLPADIAATVAAVTRVEPEYDGETNYFNEPGARGTNRTSSDLAVWWQDFAGDENLILIEVKFSEQEFGGCSKGRAVRTPCQDGGAGLIAACGAGCPLRATPHLRTYWELIAETELFAEGVFAGSRACPFYQDGYQLMRNQLLAAVIEDDPSRPERRVDFAVLYHDDNPDILRPKGFPGAERGLTAWREVIRRRDRFHIWPASEWIAAAPDQVRIWRERVAERYFDDEPGAQS